MKDFNLKKRVNEIIQLDFVTQHGANCEPYKDKFIDANSINLSLDDAIYRIFSIDKLQKTLESKKLCLVRPAKWQDPFENFLLNSTGQLNDGRLVGFENIRDKYYGQCWTLKKECDGLWRNYKGIEPSAVKVKTTVYKLMNEFYDLTNKFHTLCYFIGKVDYVTDSDIVNFFQNEINILEYQGGVEFAQSLLIKRLSFAYEEEVRIIFGKPSSGDVNLNTVKNAWDNSDYFFVNIDPNMLFEEIEIDPWLTTDKYEEQKDKIRDLGYTGQITRSSLYDKPFFITKIKI